jgi:regulator of sigma E protease
VHEGNGVGSVSKGFPAQGVLHPGDVIVAVDGHGGSVQRIASQISSHRCAVEPPVDRCKATTPATLTVERDGQRITLRMTPVYDAKQDPPKMRLGFAFDGNLGPRQTLGLGAATSRAGTSFWDITKATASIPAKILDSKERGQIHGIVGNYEVTRQTILHDTGDVIGIMAIISLALAIVNLFPFLPLDGGHIFWAIVEKIRGKPVPYSTMERSGVIGFALVLMLFAIGLTNDIGVLNGKGFGPP